MKRRKVTEQLSRKIAEYLKPLQDESNGYKFKYSWSFDSLIIEIVEQNSVYDDFVPINTKLFIGMQTVIRLKFM